MKLQDKIKQLDKRIVDCLVETDENEITLERIIYCKIWFKCKVTSYGIKENGMRHFSANNEKELIHKINFFLNESHIGFEIV